MSCIKERNSENFRYIDFPKFSDKNFVKISFGNCNYTKFSSKKIFRNLYSSNKPGFIEKFNKWVDEKNLLKGGLQK